MRLERILAPLADNPVVGDDHTGQRRQKRAHQVEERLEFAQNSEGCQQGTHRAGNARGDLELALVKAQQVGKRQAAGIGVGHVGRPGGEYQRQQAEERHAQVGEDDGDVVLAGDDAHHAAGEQHEQPGGDHAHDGGLHHIAAAFCEAAVIGGDQSAQREGGHHHAHAEHQPAGNLRIVGGKHRAAVVLHHAGDDAVQADDHQRRNGEVVEPFEALESQTGRQEHDRAPDERADGHGGGAGRFIAQHVRAQRGKGAAAHARLDAEPADAGDGEYSGNDVARALFAQRARGHHRDRQAGIAGLHADEDHVGADHAVAQQDGRDDLPEAEAAADQHAADHQAGHADHAARPHHGDAQPALPLFRPDLEAGILL